MIDIVGSCVLLVLLAPVIAMLALVVRHEAGPRVLFRQTRTGRAGRRFVILKFRTVKDLAGPAFDPDTLWQAPSSLCTGHWGRWLRRTSLDELPQLLNVLRGDMSLVGPRPERPHFGDIFAREYPDYVSRQRSRAGMTGLAQVRGLRGDTSVAERVRYDNWYIDNWSLLLDLRILALTFLQVTRELFRRPATAGRYASFVGARAPASRPPGRRPESGGLDLRDTAAPTWRASGRLPRFAEASTSVAERLSMSISRIPALVIPLGLVTAMGSGPEGVQLRPPAPRSSPAADSAARPLPVPVVRSTAATGLNVPWGVAFLPDGAALVAERDRGRIVRISPAGRTTVVGNVPGVVHEGEGGLLGIALSPFFPRDRLVFAYVTAVRDNRILRLRYGTDGKLTHPATILSGIPKAYNHNGGRILFGPDRMLYVGTGDAAVRARAQDRKSLGGKILRMTPAGKPAPGNPFKGSVVWTYGHRNVQGLAFDSHHRLWASELGQDTYDELNLIRKGQNYGWPIVEGRGGGSRFVDPLVVWKPVDASPSGLAYASGSLWMGALRGARLWRIPVNGDKVGHPTFYFRQAYGRLRTVITAPKRGIWVTTSNTDGVGQKRPGDDRILRVALL